jgi:hypothetical protein
MTGSAYQAQLVAQLRAAEDELARRRRAAEQVRALHYPEGSMWGGLQCYECQHEYPCPTVTALGGEPAATSVMEAQRYRLAWQSARSRALANLAALDATLDTSALSYALVDAHAELRATEEARDGAYRERAHLTAWLATLHPAVIAPAPDVDEPGWQILYLTAGGRQMSWHIHPRDADLYAHVERVPADDPRAQWDGHTTEAKYQAIQGLAAATGDHSAATRNVIKASDHVNGTANVIKERSCPPDCTTAHTYEAPCTVDPLAVPNGSIPYLGSGRGMWAWTCGGADWCDGMSRTDYSSAADARRAYDRHVRHAHAESLPATHESRTWEDDGEWNVSCKACPAYVDNIGGRDDAEQWAAEHKARP